MSQAYHTLLKPHCLEEYQVYAYLKRSGYIVQKRTYFDQSALETWHYRVPFRKSDTGPPDYRVLIARAWDNFPADTVLHQLEQLTPKAPLCFAIVEGSTIVFYMLESAEVVCI